MGLALQQIKQDKISKDLQRIYGQNLLSWFANNSDSKIMKNDFSFSGKYIHRFFAYLGSDKSLGGFGRSQDEFTAAVKGCAEAVERKVYQSHIARKDLLNLDLIEGENFFEINPAFNKKSIDPSFYNSNGWAVGFTKESALERAKIEAIERHLLLYTFLKDGWNGFFIINRMKLDRIELISLVSKYTLAGYSAGIGVAKSPKFLGASFGYLCDKTEKIKFSPKWEQAFYESYDYLRVRSQLEEFKPNSDSISQGLNYYLENDSNLIFADEEKLTEIGNTYCSSAAIIELKEMHNFEFPFFAAVVHGGDLLPLFFKRTLAASGEKVLLERFKQLRLPVGIPERHPIL